MTLLAFVRRFSIRSRMLVTAIAATLALLCVGGVGLGAQTVAQSTNRDFIDHDLAAMKLIAQLRTGMVSLRTYEKDMIIHYEKAAEVTKAKERWVKALAQVDDTARRLREVLRSEQDRAQVDEAIAHLAKFKAAFLPVARQLEADGFDSARVAWTFMTRAQGDYDAAQKKLEALGDGLDAAAVAGGERLDTTATWVKRVLVVAVLLAVAVIVPLTLVNMKTICSPIRDAEKLANAIAQGDLRDQPEHDVGRDEVASLERALWSMRRRLRAIVAQIRASTESISIASQEISSGSHDLSQRTEKAAANLQETASSMAQLTGTLKESADSAHEADQLAKSAADVAQRGGTVVADVVSTMKDIDDSSKRIAEIISVIDGIAFQTNILALNAAVEAARAGTEGRGFAVVAAEVRNLAQRSAAAAKEIKALVQTSVQRVEAGSRFVDDAGSTMQEIVQSVQGVTGIIGAITVASMRQSDGLSQVNSSVGDLDRMTQQNAALVEQSAAAVESLKEQALNLAQAICVFKLDEERS
ncbi:methyl-accepting chemotaxis protein [Rhizobacter sp. J219]|uniref:methyl-accepting chemotaxis protein n=1 Tax=Rhizobacter sp. J219 TaxID=2898430 RepID=UPI002151B18B|nr:methyl-accepting chemotaxis protein [Rhizobacter sp. J219]MCR5882319.1 methyl-accepting chemotaxis protein [Rhizobacter sp. J219]